MLKKTVKKNLAVIEVKTDCITDEITENILKEIKKGKKTGLNLGHVQSINSKLFINCLIKEKFKLFNLKDNVLTYLGIIIKDGHLRSYINFNDFKENKRELVKRKFLIA